MAICRVIALIAALFVVCDSEARLLKLSCPLSEAMFTTTPLLSIRCGHAARVR